jgi:hypothetical protein
LLLLAKYCLGNQKKEDEVGGACATYGEDRNIYWVLVGKPEGKRPLERHGHKWEDNIEMDPTEIGWKGVDWICLPQATD